MGPLEGVPMKSRVAFFLLALQFFFSSLCPLAPAANLYEENSYRPTIGYSPSSQISGYTETKKALDENSENGLVSFFQSLWENVASAFQGGDAGKKYYLSLNGSDSGDGSSGYAWRSLNYAVSKLKAGDTLYISEGVYDRQSADFVSSGTADAYITIQGVGNVTFEGKNLYEYEPVFDTKGKSHLRFNNIKVKNARAAVDVTAGSHHVEIDTLITDGNDFAVKMSGASFITIRNAYAINSRNSFRGDNGTHDVLMEHIETYNSKDIYAGYDPNYTNGDGFIFESNTSNITIRDAISGNHWDAGFDIKSSNVLLENVIGFGNKNGLKLWGNNVTVVNALMYGNKKQSKPDGGYVDGNGVNIRSGSVRILNSTFVDNEDIDVKVGTSSATLYMENSIVARKCDCGRLLGQYGNYSDNNVLWFKQNAGPEFAIDANNFWADPGFMDWDNKNFKLSANSAAVDKGRANAALPGHDLENENRIEGNAVDLGAYEYRSASPAPTPAPAPAPSPSSGGDTLTERSGASYDSSLKKFGDSSGKFLRSNSQFFTAADKAEFQLGGGTGNFTVEAWVNFSSTSNEQGIVGQYGDLNNNWGLYWKGDQGKLKFAVQKDGAFSVLVDPLWTPSANTWYHVAVIRGWGGNPSQIAITVDGKVIASVLNSSAVDNLAADLWVGQSTNNTGNYFSGNIDEVRISKTARWTSNFTVRSAENTSDNDTSFLAHF